MNWMELAKQFALFEFWIIDFLLLPQGERMLGDDTSSAPNMKRHLRDLSLRTENWTSAGCRHYETCTDWPPENQALLVVPFMERQPSVLVVPGGVLWQWNSGDTVWQPKCCSIGMTSRWLFHPFSHIFLWNVPLGSHVRPLEQWDGRDRPEFGRAAKGQRLVDTSARGEIGLWIERCPGLSTK